MKCIECSQPYDDCICRAARRRAESQKSHDTAPAVLDSDAHQFAVEYASLSVNGKRHARAMIAGLVRLEQGGV